MRLRSLFIDNLRNIAAARLQPGPGLNLLHGDNGAGKTTVLEAMVVLAKGRSFRTGPIASLLGPEQPVFRVVADVETDEGNRHRVGIERSREGWRGRLDGADISQVTELSKLFPLILMEPTSLQLVSGAPEFRRRFLDWSVFHVKHGFLDVWRRYSRALRQRNAALRGKQMAMARTLDPQLDRLAGDLQQQRSEVFDRLRGLAEPIMQSLSPDLGDLELQLRPGWKGASLADALADNMERDLEHGFTRDGPHRADLAFRLDGRAVRDRMSRGEQKILAAGLLLAQAQLFASQHHQPLLLLDDLASEFDRHHLERVVGLTARLGAQYFITGTSMAPYEGLLDSAVVFHVKQGMIIRETASSDDQEGPKSA